MRVLAACEESQEVCKAFRALGHEAALKGAHFIGKAMNKGGEG